MISTKKFGGHGQMRVNLSPEMISYNSKIWPTWTGSTRRAFGAYTQTQRFPFNLERWGYK